MSLRSLLRKLFSTKQNPVSRLILMALGKDNIWTPENYKNLSEAGYKNCTTVYSCINQISKNAAGLEWQVENREGKAIDNHPFIELLNRPNDYQGKRAFMIEMIGHLLLTGNAYVYQSSGGGRPRYLYNLRPDRMTVLPGKGSELVRGYRYDVDGQPQNFDTREVKHIKLFNPIDDFYGMGPVSAAARAIDIANYSDVWNASLIRNNMQPPGAFVAEGYMSTQQFDRLKDQVAAEYQGYENAGRPLLLDGGVKFTPFAMSPKDLDWLNSGKANLRAICAAFGWPSQLLGDTEASTYSNYQEARKAGYIETILPLMDFITDELQSWLLPMYSPGLKLKLQRDKIDALQENQAEKFTYLENCSFMTINEKREAVNRDGIGPDGDVLLIRMGLLPLDQAIAEPEPVPAALQPYQGDDEKPPDESPKDDEEKAATGHVARKSYWTQPERKELLWKSFEMRVKARERTFESMAKGYLAKQAEDVKRKVSAASSLDVLNAGDLIDVKAEAKRYMKTFWSWYIDTFRRGGEAGMRAAKGELFDDAEFKDAAGKFNVLKIHEQKLTDMIFNSGTEVSYTTLEAVKKALLAGAAADMTVDEFAQQLYEKLQDFTPWKARLWSRTESAKVDNWANLEGYKETEFVNKKGWMCSFVPASRDSHMKADSTYSQGIPLDEYFDIGGTPMLYPGDPSAGPAEVCNCLCSTYPIVE